MLWLLRILVILVVFLAVQSSRGADTLHVRQGAIAGGKGLSWATAFGSLYDALDAWKQGDEIWVAKGTYTVLLTEHFVFKNSMRIYGGFKGTEILREHRDWLRFETILSADILGNDGNSPVEASNPLRLDNAQDIAFVGGNTDSIVDSSTVIDGLQFKGVSTSVGSGSAMRITMGSPVVRNCTFQENVTQGAGAAVFVYGGGRPRFEYCAFVNNHGLHGAGIYVSDRVDSGSRGPIVAQCAFENNSVTGDGAGINLFNGRMDIVSSIFYHNVALGGGGAIYGDQMSRYLVYNSTFARNEGGSQRGWMFEGYGADIVSCIFWHGADPIGALILRPENTFDTAAIHTQQCLVQNDAMYGFYQIDPLFVDVENPKGVDGFWGTDDDGLRVEPNSICRDKGLVTSYTNFTRIDAIGNPRVVGNKPDIGAYEWQRDGHDDYVAIMNEIRTGKLVLLYRHGITDWSSQDPGPSTECFPGRNLSEDGRDQTKSVGKYIKALNVPLEDVFTSTACRCWESALYMAGRYDKKSHWASGGGAANDALRKADLVNIPVNGCRMINTHDAVIVPSIDASSAEMEEGDNAVLRPDGTNFTWISHFTSDNWERYRVRFPDASVGVEEDPSSPLTQLKSDLNMLLYSAIRIEVYNVLGAQLLSASGETQTLYNAIGTLANGWYAVVATNADGSKRAVTVIR
ncbi:MAG: histidine phosphatase family protein [bacterium]|nr:histidine phosphatase family protein [bacterium]